MPVGFPRRRGVTLIEAVLFISIALGLIVGGIVFFQQAQTAQRSSETVRLVTALLSESRSLFQNVDIGTVNVDTILVAAEAVPSNAIIDPPVNTCVVRSPWGDCIRLNNDAANDRLTLDMYQIPPEICARLIIFDQDGNGPLSTGMAGVNIRSLVSDWRTSFTTNTTVEVNHFGIPVSPALAGDYCNRVRTVQNWVVSIHFEW